MNPSDYTSEQKQDIEERVGKAKKALEELKLQPAAQIFKVNIGDDQFADKLVPFLQDTKYSGSLSPLQAKDL